LRKASAQLELERDHFAQADRVDGRHADGFVTGALQAAQVALKGLVAAGHVLAEAKIRLARGGQFERTVGAVDQLYVQPVLDRLNPLTGGGLGNTM